MTTARVCVLLLALAAAAAAAAAAPRARRQLATDDALQPLEVDGAGAEEQTREKRKFEGVTQAKFGVKNAILGFVFGKINSIIDAKTRLIDTLDRQNIEKNKAYGIEPPAGGLASLSGVVGQVIGPKLQFLGPKLQGLTGLLGGASGGSGGGSAGGSGGGLGSILSLVTSLSGSSSGGAGATAGGGVETVDSSEEDES